MIVRGTDGRHHLVDLSSSNGTFVDGQAIERHTLEPNGSFQVFDIQIAYEQAISETAARQIPTDAINMQSLRGTVELRRFEAPTDLHPAGEEIEETLRSPLEFEHPDGDVYQGDLLDDIASYHALRPQHLRGGFGTASLQRQFERLRIRLRQPQSTDPKVSKRTFCRFGCWFSARLRLGDDTEYACHVRDFGVDGAQIVIADHEVTAESIVWLAIELQHHNGRSLIFPGRVAWTDGEFLGLAFSGSSQRVQGRYAEQPGHGHRESAIESG